MTELIDTCAVTVTDEITLLRERLDEAQKGLDADVLLLYDENADPVVIREKMLEWTQQGVSVMAQPRKPENMHFGKVCRLQGNEVFTLENDA